MRFGYWVGKFRHAAMGIAVVAGLAAIALFAGQAQASMMVNFSSDYEPGSIVIKTSKKKLYYVTGNGKALEYSIAVGRKSEQWFGEIWVSRKATNPVWIPTPSMRAKNPSLPKKVGPGPKNPLGTRAIYLGWGPYRIHGTNSPGSIGRAASSGCFRMRNSDVVDLYRKVHVGTSVFVLK